MAKIEGYRSIFITGSLILTLIAALPILGLFIHIPDSSERFSELWLLGPSRKADGYPFNIQANESYLIYVGVANRLGRPAFYRVYVKLRNQTQALPTTSNSSSSILPPLYEFNMFIKDDEVWEEPLNFTILEMSTPNNTTLLKRLRINGVIYQINSFSEWDEKRNGFYYQLFFELWLYNMTSSSFQYHNRFVGIWLNMTGS